MVTDTLQAKYNKLQDLAGKHANLIYHNYINRYRNKVVYSHGLAEMPRTEINGRPVQRNTNSYIITDEDHRETVRALASRCEEDLANRIYWYLLNFPQFFD